MNNPRWGLDCLAGIKELIGCLCREEEHGTISNKVIDCASLAPFYGIRSEVWGPGYEEATAFVYSFRRKTNI